MKNLLLGFFLLLIVGFFVYPKFFIKKIDKELPVKQTSKIFVNTPPASIPLLVNQIIENQKLDKKYGYDLEIVITQPQDNMASLLTGKSQLTYLGPSEVVNANKNGKNLQMFAFGLKVFCPFIAKSSFIISTNDDPLKGKNIAVLKKPTEPYSMLERLMKNNSKELVSYFNVIETDMLSLPILLTKGDVEVSNICNVISITKLLSQKNKFKIVGSTEEMIKKQENLINLPFVGIVALESWVKNNPKLVQSYLLSQKDALKYLDNNFKDHTKTELFKKTFNLSENETSKLVSLIKERNYFSFPDWNKSIEDIKKFTRDDFDNSSFIELK